ncbi:MAG: hypothetical protein HY300_09595 [Verrucomicrobia bacterium]|nr:hypothetical protein [Verrucomicrobiota bacterium]
MGFIDLLLNLAALLLWLSFRAAAFPSPAIAPAASLLSTLAVFYLWLVLLSVANARLPEQDFIQRLVRLHLGWTERLPALLRLLLPPLLIIVAWRVAQPSLVNAGVLPAARDAARVWEQGVVLAAGAIFAWKFIIAGLMVLHLANSYVYLGEAAFWPWVDATAKNLLGPLKKIPLRFARVDLTPVAAIALVWIAAHFGLRMLTQLFQRLVS